jgi:hypothetical protein
MAGSHGDLDGRTGAGGDQVRKPRVIPLASALVALVVIAGCADEPDPNVVPSASDSRSTTTAANTGTREFNAGVATSSPRTPPSTARTTVAAGTPDKFEQTWSKGYASTTCTDWHTRMSSHERRVAAADMLVSARKVDGGESLPSDRLIASFENDISEGCEPIATMTISEIAAAIYLIGKAQYEP